ncbi:cell surface protein [Methanosarcina barkeri 3]|uniref:Cell surface protein n=1 Tax=Methanosarcina barkeri 3 TaxID=1434107 RepID=A0A0E3SHI9_METBA|nr:PKD domain-containing protein [Methanosarcina barkeri]AKB80696.1 cell surface protein [Methanosarcina barkeri 3]
MKINKKSYLIILVSTVLFFVFSILISSLALAAQEIRLSEDIGENGEPSIYGDKVVWVYWDKIHLYDLKTRNDTTIIIPEHYYAANSAIYDNKIVWYLCNSNDVEHSSKFCVYDILTSTSSLITENVSYYDRPDIYGDRFVWVGMSHICMYNISTQIQTQIPINGFARDLTIYDNKIVWVGYGNGTIIDKNKNSIGRSDIYMYDLSTSKETRITTSGLASTPAIYGDRIVWQDKRNLDVLTGGIGDIYMYNLSTEKESRISYSGQSSSGSSPAIYGDRIVWQDRRNGKEDIYMYNLSSQKESQITTSGSAHSPDIYGDRIVYRDNRQRLPPGDGYFSDIYMYDLTARHIEPQAGFISNVTSGTAPLTVLFTDTSTGGVPTSWYWDTGDGAYSGHAMNTTHTFTKPGVYNVTLTVANEAGNNTVTKPDYIIVTSPKTLIAKVFANVTSGPAPLDVQFYDTSTGGVPTSWYWDTGDGVYSRHAMNTTNTFTNPGLYDITLTVANEVSNSTVTKKSYINVTSPINANSPKKPVADFFADVISGTTPLTVLFTDTSTGGVPTSWYWDFGDGTYSDHARNTTHTFTNPGLYDITLTVANEAGNSTAIGKSYITVTFPKTPVAYFSANVTSGTAPLTVLFAATRHQTLLYTEIINGGVPTSWHWDFGDGISSKRAMNVTHTFAKPGNYTVSLTAENAAGKSTATKPGYIVVTNPGTPVADCNSKITEG